MGMSVTKKLIASHQREGEAIPDKEIGIRIDQTLTQDVAGTLLMHELEANGVERVQTELSAQRVDHNLLQEVTKLDRDQIIVLPNVGGLVKSFELN